MNSLGKKISLSFIYLIPKIQCARYVCLGVRAITDSYGHWRRCFLLFQEKDDVKVGIVGGGEKSKKVFFSS